MTSPAVYKNVGSITYVYDGKRSIAVWPYFTYGRKIANTLQLSSTLGGPPNLEAIALANAIAAKYAAIAAQINTSTTVINVSNPVVPPIKPFTTNTLTLATKVVVATIKKNSSKAIKPTPKKPTTTKQSSPGKGTPNKNPVIPPPPPPPPPSPPQFSSDPDKIMQQPCPMCIASLDPNNRSYCPPCEPCPPGWYVGPEGECLKCLIKGYVKGSRCAPCPPGTTGESIHTGCSQVGPDGKTYTFIA